MDFLADINNAAAGGHPRGLSVWLACSSAPSAATASRVVLRLLSVVALAAAASPWPRSCSLDGESRFQRVRQPRAVGARRSLSSVTLFTLFAKTVTYATGGVGAA